MDEIPDDEGNIGDPFDSEMSDIDESNENEDDSPQNDRNFAQSFFNSMKFKTPFKMFTKYKRLFHENQASDWHQFENSPDFADKEFDRSKVSPSIGYRRDGITEEMLNDPYQLYEYIYGAARSGRGLAIHFTKKPYHMYHIMILYLSNKIQKDILRWTNKRIHDHNTRVTSVRRKIKPICSEELKLLLGTLILAKL